MYLKSIWLVWKNQVQLKTWKPKKYVNLKQGVSISKSTNKRNFHSVWLMYLNWFIDIGVILSGRPHQINLFSTQLLSSRKLENSPSQILKIQIQNEKILQIWRKKKSVKIHASITITSRTGCTGLDFLSGYEKRSAADFSLEKKMRVGILMWAATSGGFTRKLKARLKRCSFENHSKKS